MKFRVFEKQILELKRFYDEAVLRDEKIQDALGGDTQVMTDWWGSHLDKSLDILKEEFNADGDIIDWLFFDCICSNSEETTLTVDGIEYIGNIKNVFLILTNSLDERLGDIVIESLNEAPETPEYREEDLSTYFEAPVREDATEDKHEGLNENEKMVDGTPVLLELKDYQIKLESVELAEKLEELVHEKFDDNNGEWSFPKEHDYREFLESTFKTLKIDARNLGTKKKLQSYFIAVLSQFTNSEASMDMAMMEVKIVLERGVSMGEIYHYDLEQDEDTIYGVLRWEGEDESPKQFSISITDQVIVTWS